MKRQRRAGRRPLGPTELPVGLVTSPIGGPYLLSMLWRGDRPKKAKAG